MPLNDIYKMRVYCYDADLTQVAINTTYWQTTAEAGTGATQFAMASALDALLSPVYIAAMSSRSIYRGLTFQKISPGLPLVASVSTGNNGPGSVGATTAPGQVSGLISFKTPFAGKGFRGRIYIPFPYSTAADGQGRMVAGYQTVLRDIAAVYVAPHTIGAGGNTTTLECSIQHRENPGAIPPVYRYYSLDSSNVPLAFATQRRRGQFGRTNPLPI